MTRIGHALGSTIRQLMPTRAQLAIGCKRVAALVSCLATVMLTTLTFVQAKLALSACSYFLFTGCMLGGFSIACLAFVLWTRIISPDAEIL